MLKGGGVHKNLTFADGGEGGVQNGLRNADVINERPLILTLSINRCNITIIVYNLFSPGSCLYYFLAQCPYGLINKEDVLHLISWD